MCRAFLRPVEFRLWKSATRCSLPTFRKGLDGDNPTHHGNRIDGQDSDTWPPQGAGKKEEQRILRRRDAMDGARHRRGGRHYSL